MHPKSGKLNTVKHPLQVKHACHAKEMIESFAIQGEEEERNMRRSNKGCSGPGFKCFLNRIQDYEEAKETARKICEKKGLPEFCKCKPFNDNIMPIYFEMECGARLRASHVQHWKARDKHLGKVTTL